MEARRIQMCSLRGHHACAARCRTVLVSSVGYGVATATERASYNCRPGR